MLDVRRYRSADAAACCSAINAAIQEMDGLNDAARRFIAAKNVPAILDAELAPLFSIVAEAGERILGLGALDGDEIRRVYVHPTGQHQGVGDALMDGLESEAIRRGLAELALEASPSSVGFYERRGYVARPCVRDTVHGAEFTYVPMRKSLT
jgi:GNAT superfamily N-acetyltransferase